MNGFRTQTCHNYQTYVITRLFLDRKVNASEPCENCLFILMNNSFFRSFKKPQLLKGTPCKVALADGVKYNGPIKGLEGQNVTIFFHISTRVSLSAKDGAHKREQ